MVAALHDGCSSPAEQLRFDAAQNAVHVYQRARLFRQFAVVFTLSVWLARALGATFCNDLGDAAIRPVLGISLLVSFFTCCLEWSTRWQCRESLDQFHSDLEQLETTE